MDIFDIARIAGVSRKTVQRVLNNASNVHPDTRAKICRVMEEHHYEPNEIARKLSSKKTKTIGIFIVQDVTRYKLYIDDLFFGTVIGAMISYCAERGYKALVTIIDVSNIDPLLSIYKQKSIDGGLLISWSNIQSVIDRVTAAGFHIGVFDQNNVSHPNKELLIPFLNNYQSAYEATSYLLELGHEDLAIITGDSNNPSSSERLHGFMDAVQERGLTVPESNIYYGNFTEEVGVTAVEYWIREDCLPKALFCSNDLLAYGVLKTLLNHGVSVPEQISVIGFDDLLISQYTHPPLTTMRVPRIEMAVALTNRLINKLENNEDENSKMHFQAELIVRSSCARFQKEYQSFIDKVEGV
jgi:LacI family transcriptional regulator